MPRTPSAPRRGETRHATPLEVTSQAVGVQFEWRTTQPWASTVPTPGLVDHSLDLPVLRLPGRVLGGPPAAPLFSRTLGNANWSLIQGTQNVWFWIHRTDKKKRFVSPHFIIPYFA